MEPRLVPERDQGQDDFGRPASGIAVFYADRAEMLGKEPGFKVQGRRHDHSGRDLW
ncbi:hypothetical protein [uncultured Lamprocystis sp.]|jgi:hypothetical protein|uniref:hypothetical protein n=1 Tax=uncultured Lamprocystis sp. TaxID=543132 RepID=UPI0025FE40AB|nr:hypothetical protein [uncultured Lamprocystis sp.]